MERKLLIWIIVLFLIATSVQAVRCSDDTALNDIPCEIVSPYIEGRCTQYNYTVTNVNTSINVQNGTMSPVGDGTYNFTFNHTTLFNMYSIALCSNNTVTVNVVLNTTSGWDTALIIALIIIAGIYIILSVNINKTNYALKWFLFFAGLGISLAMTAFLKLINEVSTTTSNVNSYLDMCYNISMVALYFSLIYFFINLIIRIFLAFVGNKEE